jgi:hypothetical protein
MGYSAGEIFKSTLPVILFLLLPALLTSLNARRLSNRPAELWGRHLRFLHRLLNVTWLVWLPVSFVSGDRRRQRDRNRDYLLHRVATNRAARVYCGPGAHLSGRFLLFASQRTTSG